MGAVADEFARRWFKHECVLHRGAGASPYGGGGTDTPFRGFVRQKVHRAEGTTQELINDTHIVCDLMVDAVVGDTVTLPTPFVGTWEITMISAHQGVDGGFPDHQRLHLSALVAQPSDPYEGGGPYG